MNLSVNDRARRIATFRHIEVRLMEITAAWTPTTPQMEVKVLFGRHIWDFAQHADWLGKRTFELRQPEQHSLPPSEEYGSLLNELAYEQSTVARLAALYDVMLPALQERYRSYCAESDSLLDGPSYAIIERILLDLERMSRDAGVLRNKLSIEGAAIGELRARERSLSMFAVR